MEALPSSKLATFPAEDTLRARLKARCAARRRPPIGSLSGVQREEGWRPGLQNIAHLRSLFTTQLSFKMGTEE
jgi:hypothetical protein